MATEIRSELRACVPTGYAAVCDQHSVIALDLERDGEVVGAHELPHGCGAPNFRSSSPSDIVIACPMNGIVLVATAEGVVTREIQAGRRAGSESDSVTRRNPIDVFLAFDTVQGVGVLYVDGTYALFAQGEVALSRALPPGKRVLFSSPITETADGTVVIAYRDRYFDTVASGFVVFDTRRGAVDNVVDASLGSVVSVDGRMLLAGDGVQFVDPGTGQREDIAPRPALAPGSVLIR